MTVPLEFSGPAGARVSLTSYNGCVKTDLDLVPRSPQTLNLPSAPSDDVVAHSLPRHP